MNVLVVEPDFAPYEKEINGLSEMQETVGGSIQAIYPFEDMVAVVCNDEGILLGIATVTRFKVAHVCRTAILALQHKLVPYQQ